MAASVPKASVNRTIRSKTTFGVAKAATTTTLVYLNYLTFVRELLHEAAVLAQQDGAHGVMLVHLRKANNLVLRKFRG